MTDCFKMAKQFASDSAKAKGHCNFVKDIFSFKIHINLIYAIEKKIVKWLKYCRKKERKKRNKQTKETHLVSVLGFSVVCSIIFIFGHKFLFWRITSSLCPCVFVCVHALCACLLFVFKCLCSGVQNDVTQAQSGATHLMSFCNMQKYIFRFTVATQHFLLMSCTQRFSLCLLFTINNDNILSTHQSKRFTPHLKLFWGQYVSFISIPIVWIQYNTTFS